MKLQFQGILKPAYNSVDMAEIELMDHDRGPREFDEGIIMVRSLWWFILMEKLMLVFLTAIFSQLRNDVVNQANGSVTLHTKYHYDDMVSRSAV